MIVRPSPPLPQYVDTDEPCICGKRMRRESPDGIKRLCPRCEAANAWGYARGQAKFRRDVREDHS